MQAGKMVLEGETRSENGEITMHRISWTQLSDGRVKQHWQTKTLKSKQWQVSFIGFYHSLPD